MSEEEAGKTHEALKPLCWLIGKWKSVSAKGKYPTIEPFTFCEELKFESIGQPMLNYKSVTWHPKKKEPMHLESGFLRIKPCSNNVAFMVSHNFGLTTLEEGTVDGLTLSLKSCHISRMSFAKDPAVTEIKRTYQFCCDTKRLEYLLCMATSKTPMTEHLRVSYEKQKDKEC